MALRVVSNLNTPLEFISGDTEYLRLNLKDTDGNYIVLSGTYKCVLGIKRNVHDIDYVIPQVEAVIYQYDSVNQLYSIEFQLDSNDTKAILEYDGKERNSVTVVYDVELTSPTYEVSTILAGKLTVKRSIGGIV